MTESKSLISFVAVLINLSLIPQYPAQRTEWLGSFVVPDRTSAFGVQSDDTTLPRYSKLETTWIGSAPSINAIGSG